MSIIFNFFIEPSKEAGDKASRCAVFSKTNTGNAASSCSHSFLVKLYVGSKYSSTFRCPSSQEIAKALFSTEDAFLQGAFRIHGKQVTCHTYHTHTRTHTHAHVIYYIFSVTPHIRLCDEHYMRNIDACTATDEH